MDTFRLSSVYNLAIHLLYIYIFHEIDLKSFIIRRYSGILALARVEVVRDLAEQELAIYYGVICLLVGVLSLSGLQRTALHYALCSRQGLDERVEVRLEEERYPIRY